MNILSNNGTRPLTSFVVELTLTFDIAMIWMELFDCNSEISLIYVCQKFIQ